MPVGRSSRTAQRTRMGPHPRSSPALRGLLGVTAFVLVVGGLLLFSHGQTQPLFQTAEDVDPTSTQSPRNDGGTLMGAFMAATGLTLCFALISPLRREDRLIPAAILTGTTTLILAAHFSIFTNGLTFPDQQAIAMQSTVLFHDTAATIPMATFILAFGTLLGLILGGLAVMALLTPRVLDEHVLKPRTLHGQRVRLLVVTLLLHAVGAAFVRQFISFGLMSGTNPVGPVYHLMGLALLTLLLFAAWRSYHSLWGRLETNGSASNRKPHPRLMRIELALCALLVVFTVVTLFGEPVYEPDAGTDPVFAISSIGASWVFLLVLAVYLLQRSTTRSYHRFLSTLKRPLPHIKSDRLLTFSVLTVLLWTLGALWTFHSALNPLGALALRLLPIVVLLPLFALRATPPTTGHWSARTSPIMLFGWAALSILTGIMFWGIGNSVMVVFSETSGLVNAEGRLLDPVSGGARLLGSLLMVAPVVVGMGLLGGRRQNSTAPTLLVVTGVTMILLLHTLMTIDPVTRYNPGLGHTDVLVGFWAAALPAETGAMMRLVIGASAAVGLIAGIRHLYHNVDQEAPPLPTSRFWRLSFGASKRYGKLRLTAKGRANETN